jgi:hypothetical protein
MKVTRGRAASPERFRNVPGNYEESLVGRESYLLEEDAIFRTVEVIFWLEPKKMLLSIPH